MKVQQDLKGVKETTQQIQSQMKRDVHEIRELIDWNKFLLCKEYT